MSVMRTWSVLFFCILFEYSLSLSVAPEPPEKRLREYLLKIGGWKFRPVRNNTDRLSLNVSFQLTRIVELDLRDQLLTLYMNIFHEWTHYKLKWNPEDFAGVEEITVESSKIWLPDIVPYTIHREFTLKSNSVKIHHSGKIIWETPAVLAAYVEVEIRHYPFDIQSCEIKFGSWTYDGNQIYLKLIDIHGNSPRFLPIGMDLSRYTTSTEWELISIPGKNIEKYYDCCVEPYLNIHFNITLRRHSRFYLFILVMPLTGLSYLSVLVFYLPVDSNEKITLCVSVVASQVMFLLLMMDNIPITSFAVPLLGKLITFNMTLVFFSVICTTFVLNVYHRKPTTHNMPKWVRLFRYSFLPKILMIEAFPVERSIKDKKKGMGEFLKTSLDSVSSSLPDIEMAYKSAAKSKLSVLQTAFSNVYFVKSYLARNVLIEDECEEWKFLAAILDRIFLIVFNLVFVSGTCFFMMDAAALYDDRQAIVNAHGPQIPMVSSGDTNYTLLENDTVTSETSNLVFD